MIIGIGGSKGAGKNTAAEALVREGFVELAWAHPLKSALAQSLCESYALFHDQDKKEARLETPIWFSPHEIDRLIDFLAPDIESILIPKIYDALSDKLFYTPREVLQYVATDVFRRQVDDDFWVKLFLKEASKYPNVVAPDTRFPNERAAIRSAGGKLVLIEREGLVADKHISENLLGSPSDYHVTISNCGNIEELQHKLSSWYVGVRAMSRIGL